MDNTTSEQEVLFNKMTELVDTTLNFKSKYTNSELKEYIKSYFDLYVRMFIENQLQDLLDFCLLSLKLLIKEGEDRGISDLGLNIHENVVVSWWTIGLKSRPDSILQLNRLFAEAKSFYKDCDFNTCRKTLEMIRSISSFNIDHKVFYFKVLIKIDGGLSPNDYENNLIMAEKEFELLSSIFQNSPVGFESQKKEFNGMLDDYLLFRDKVQEIRNRFSTY